jgi:hypothetical protein
MMIQDNTHLSLYGSTALVNLAAFQFLNLYTVGRTPWNGGISPSQGRYLHTDTQTSIPRVGFQPMIPVFERAKTVHALVHAVTVIGRIIHM